MLPDVPEASELLVPVRTPVAPPKGLLLVSLVSLPRVLPELAIAPPNVVEPPEELVAVKPSVAFISAPVVLLATSEPKSVELPVVTLPVPPVNPPVSAVLPNDPAKPPRSAEPPVAPLVAPPKPETVEPTPPVAFPKVSLGLLELVDPRLPRDPVVTSAALPKLPGSLEPLVKLPVAFPRVSATPVSPGLLEPANPPTVVLPIPSIDPPASFEAVKVPVVVPNDPFIPLASAVPPAVPVAALPKVPGSLEVPLIPSIGFPSIVASPRALVLVETAAVLPRDPVAPLAALPKDSESLVLLVEFPVAFPETPATTASPGPVSPLATVPKGPVVPVELPELSEVPVTLPTVPPNAPVKPPVPIELPAALVTFPNVPVPTSLEPPARPLTPSKPPLEPPKPAALPKAPVGKDSPKPGDGPPLLHGLQLSSLILMTPSTYTQGSIHNPQETRGTRTLVVIVLAAVHRSRRAVNEKKRKQSPIKRDGKPNAP
ncbi:hypothetical protein VNI00_014462 [Paramarasmius palmivorus]|uniref:Proline-rich extensin-like protein EPR1 n=1 Tax=Paramarasmius palmivorus TaxID=297713 RepID=A0AAW0BQN5_9AGAR